MSRGIPPGISLLLLAAAFAAGAQTAPQPAADTKDEPKSHEKVQVTAPSLVDERRQSTAAKIVVGHDELVSHGDTTLLDALKRLPGVTVSGTGGRGSEIRLRGLGNGYTQILVNGEPVPPGFSLETLDPDLIERIEIYRTATAEFSTQAIAGTINIVTRQAMSRRRRDAKLSWTRSNARDSFNLSAQVADKEGKLAYTLPFSVGVNGFYGTDHAGQVGTDPAGTRTLDWLTTHDNRGRGESANFSPRLDWTFARDHTLSSETFFYYNRFHGVFDESTVTALGAPPQFASDNLDVVATNYALRTNLVYTRQTAGGGQLEARLGLGHFRRISHVLFDANDDAGTFILHRTVDGHVSDDNVTTRGKYLLPFVPGHAIALGWDGEERRRLEDRLQIDNTPTGLPTFDIDESYDARVLRMAFFAQDEWEITPRLSSYLGLRWEGIDTRDIGNLVAQVHNRSGVWSPIVQAVWKLPGTEKDQVRVGLARTYKAPTTQQLIPRRYIANNNTATTPDFQGNPELKPELAWGLDLAYEHYFSGGGVFSVSAFSRRIDSVILQSLSNVNGTFITQPANEGKASTRGIELDTKANLRTFFPSAPSMDLHANLTIARSSVDFLPGPNNRLDGQTPLSGTAGFDYKSPSLPLTCGASFTFRSGGPVVLSGTQTKYTSVRRTLDLYALWKFSPSVQLRGTLSNLLAQDYLDAEGYHDPTGTLDLSTLESTHRRVGLVLEVKL
ncbi:MAG TPA: TonB-dependent receptor [Usitatibacter sp.]|nr:TonB-dependent receptor [Usitatibacter sp.]